MINLKFRLIIRQFLTQKSYSFLSFISLFFINKDINAQTYYAMDASCSNLFEVNVTAGDCECELTPIFNNPVCFIDDVTYCTDGEFYTTADGPFYTYGVYRVDLVTGSLILAYPFPPGTPPSY